MRKKRSRKSPRFEARVSDYAAGLLAGRGWRRRCGAPENERSACLAAQRRWYRRVSSATRTGRHWTALLRRGERYAAGFLAGAGVRNRFRCLPVPFRLSAAAVVSAPVHIKTLRMVLQELLRLPFREVIVVIREASVPHYRAARSLPGVTVVYRPDLKDAAAARALGAKLTTADTILFADGRRPVRAETLVPFLRKCGSSWDVVLNNLTPRLGTFRSRAPKYRLAEFMNRAMNRRDLSANSIASLPFALSRRGMERIGTDTLAQPPKGHAALLRAGLRVGIAPVSIPSFPERDSGGQSSMEEEFAQAWTAMFEGRGSRLLFPDKVRNRSVLGGSP
jgi:hypothetical protein